jgi:hypothetical protein
MMPKITPVNATSHEGGTVYRLLNMIHVMAGGLANADSGGWRLARTATYPGEYVLTVWTNGIVEVGAETTTDDSGEKDHYYWMIPCRDSDDTEG